VIVRSRVCLHDRRTRERCDGGVALPVDGFSFLTSSWEAKQCGFLCFRKFKIPLVHLSFYFV